MHMVDLALVLSKKLTNDQKLEEIIKWFNFFADGMKIEDGWFETDILKNDPDRFKRWKEVAELKEKHSQDYYYIANYIRDNFEELKKDDIACNILYIMYYRWQSERL